MQVTINLSVDTIEKLEKFRTKELGKVEALITRYDDVNSEDSSERTLFLKNFAEGIKVLPMDELLMRYLWR